MLTVPCDNCKKRLRRPPSRIRRGHNFCNRRCKGDWLAKHNTGENNPRFDDIRGQTFGRWLVLKYAGNRLWLCECQCAKRTRRHITHTDLTHHQWKSCGCLQAEGFCRYRSTRTTSISKHENEIVEGLLLSDAGLYKLPSGAVRFQFGSEWASFAAHIERILPFDFRANTRPAYTKRVAGATKPSRCKAFHVLASPVDLSLSQYDERWYDRVAGGRGLKHVPANIELTPTIVLYWFLGDGSTYWLREENRSLCKRTRRPVLRAGGSSVTLKLHTNSFTDEDVERLIALLRSCHPEMQFGIERTVEGYPVICTSRSDSVRAFFEYIGECPSELEADMAYKWKIPTAQKLPLYGQRPGDDLLFRLVRRIRG
jgi:hypothetical protein